MSQSLPRSPTIVDLWARLSHLPRLILASIPYPRVTYSAMSGDGPANETQLTAALAGLSSADAAFARRLAGELGQAHLFDAWPASPADDDAKARLLAQARALDVGAPGGGGLTGYVGRARELLAAAKVVSCVCSFSVCSPH